MTILAPKLSTTYDAFLGGKLKILQSQEGGRAGTDAVLLAASIPAKSGQTTLEAGLGSAVVSLCVATRVSGLKMKGVEIQRELITLARQNANNNGFSDDLKIIEGDVTASGKHWQDMELVQDSFDHTFANPPFYNEADGRHPRDSTKTKAHMYRHANELERWVRFLIAHTKPRGTITLIHKPSETLALLKHLEKATGDICLFPVFPKPNMPASRIIIQGTKSKKGPMRIEPGLVMHEKDGSFSQKASAILRSGAVLELGSLQ